MIAIGKQLADCVCVCAFLLSASYLSSLLRPHMTSASPSIPSRSLIAHEDSVTCVRFQPDTHYFFSGGKDGVLKYWDADRYGAHSLPPHILAPPLLLSSSPPLITLSPLHGVMYCKSGQYE